MPRPRIPEDQKKKTLNISMSPEIIEWLREHGNFSNLIEDLVLIYKDLLEKSAEKD